MEKFFKSLFPPDYSYSWLAWLYIKQIGSCISGGGCHKRLGEGRMKVTRNKYIYIYIYLLLSYLLSVLIFIKQYSNSMWFSSIFSWKLWIIPYLCEIDVRTPTSFWSSKKSIKFKTFINCSGMNSSIIWYPYYTEQPPPPILSKKKNGDWKLGHMSYLPVVAPLFRIRHF